MLINECDHAGANGVFKMTNSLVYLMHEYSQAMHNGKPKHFGDNNKPNTILQPHRRL